VSDYLFGQLTDPNIKTLRPYFTNFIDQESNIYWDVLNNKLLVNHQNVNITSIFLRYNVFKKDNTLMYNNWHIIKNYIKYNNVKMYNKNYNYETPMKLHNLLHAKNIGLPILETECTDKTSKENVIAKPITGGEHTKEVTMAQFPVIFQKKITGKNKRLYIVNDKHFGFEIVTDKLDYRDDESSTVIKSKFSDNIVNKTKQLVKKLNLNFSASDFMEDESGIWYLETNTNPMFVAFDQEVNNQISFEIVNGLK
jgi:hypothetical protein